MSEKPRLSIIGFGRMGKRAARLFSDGFFIDVISQRDIRPDANQAGATQSENTEKSIKHADFIFLAVPYAALDVWIPKLNELTSPECVIMDCCSARGAANETLRQLARAHFGIPDIENDSVTCDGELDPRIAGYLQAKRIAVHLMEPSSQLRPTAGIAHFIGMALDLNLSATAREDLAQSGAGRCLLDLIRHLKTNSPSTYKETQLLEPDMSAIRKEIIGWFKHVDEDLDDGVFTFKPLPPETWRD